MAKLIKEFKVFYNDEVKFSGNKEIRDKKKKLKDDFLRSFPIAFKEKFGDDFTTDKIRFIDQGSYAIGTTINHGDKAYDIDVATMLNIDISSYDNPVEVKKVARDALTNTNRTPIIKGPCITVKYSTEGEEKYHIDFPIYSTNNESVYLARGYEHSDESNREWQVSDPEGLNSYFKTKNLQIEGLDLDDDEKECRKQKKRIIRYLKWWKAEKYGNPASDNEVPPSIALSILVCQYYIPQKDGKDYNDLHSFCSTVNNILDAIFYDAYDVRGERIKKIRSCELPVKPYSDCFENLNKSDNYINTFYKRLVALRNSLEYAVDEHNERKAAEKIVKMLGDKFPLPEKDKANEEDSFA